MESSEFPSTHSNFASPVDNKVDNYNYESKSPPYKFNVIPFQIEDSLDFIDIFEDGTVLLGSSNIHGKYWNGSIWTFGGTDCVPIKDRSLGGFGFEFGVTCGKFIGSSQNAVIGDESGGLCSIKFQEVSNTLHCMPVITSYCHDKAVTSLSTSRDFVNCVSSSADASIVIWETESLSQLKKYSPAHGREVTSVSVSKYHTDLIFASTSVDGSALIWDQRDSEPASCIKEDEREPLASIDWKSDYQVALASTFGNLSLFDLRNHQALSSNRLLNIPIANISFNKYGLLALSGTWNKVLVWDFDSTSSIYKDTRHNGRISGVCWHPTKDLLYSCGEGKEIYRHDIDLSPYTNKLDQLKIS